MKEELTEVVAEAALEQEAKRATREDLLHQWRVGSVAIAVSGGASQILVESSMGPARCAGAATNRPRSLGWPMPPVREVAVECRSPSDNQQEWKLQCQERKKGPGLAESYRSELSSRPQDLRKRH